MNKSYRILVLEDVAEDAELIMNEVQSSAFKYEFRQTDNEHEFKLFIKQFKPDIILSDYRLPDYDGISALKYVLEHAPRIPFIVITGSINEETAVNCMKLGAVDYILKDKMNRLGQAVQSALKNAEMRKEKEESDKTLVKREFYYRNILKYMHDDIMIISREYIITDVNSALLSVEGYKKEDVIGKHCYDIRGNYVSPCTMKGSDCPMKQVLDTGETVRFQKSMITENGKTVWNDILMSPLYDEYGVISHVIESYRDITELVQVKESNLRLFSAVEQSSAATIMQDAEGKVEYVNNAFTVISGYTKEEILGKSMITVNSGDLPEKERDDLYRQVMNGESRRMIFHNRKKEGSDYWVSAAMAPFTDTEGKISGIVEVQEDITDRIKDRKQIEANLKEKELLLHEIFHRVNNNLQIMISLLNMQMERTVKPSEREVLKAAQTRVAAMAIIENMLYQEQDIVHIRPRYIVESIFSMLAESLPVPYGAVTLQLETDDCAVELKTAQPWALIINELLSNCLKHAYPEGKGIVSVKVSVNHSHELVLLVRDTGIGMAETIEPRESGTTGLRLVYLLAEGQLGGSVSFSKDGGTSVTVTCRNA